MTYKMTLYAVLNEASATRNRLEKLVASLLASLFVIFCKKTKGCFFLNIKCRKKSG